VRGNWGRKRIIKLLVGEVIKICGGKF